MVLKKHRNGVLVVWVISSRNTTDDIKKWLAALFAMGMKERQDWNVKAFIIDDAAAEIQALRYHIFFYKRNMKNIFHS